MKVFSLRPGAVAAHPLPEGRTNAGAGPCHDCHNVARWLVTLGTRRPPLKLCDRCARYLAGTLIDRLTEQEEKKL